LRFSDGRVLKHFCRWGLLPIGYSSERALQIMIYSKRSVISGLFSAVACRRIKRAPVGHFATKSVLFPRFFIRPPPTPARASASCAKGKTHNLQDSSETRTTSGSSKHRPWGAPVAPPCPRHHGDGLFFRMSHIFSGSWSKAASAAQPFSRSSRAPLHILMRRT